MKDENKVKKSRKLEIIEKKEEGKKKMKEKMMMFGGDIKIEGEVKEKKERIKKR